MRKFLFKTLCLVLVIAALLIWFRSDATVLASNTALGIDDTGAWLASNSQNSKAFDVLESMNTSMLRVELPWNEVEMSPGAFIWSYQSDSGYMDYDQLFQRLERRNIRPVVVLSGGPSYMSHLYPQQSVSRESMLENWQNYVRAAVQQFGSQVDYWQIGSAINDAHSWGQVMFPGATDPEVELDVELYAQMLTSAYNIIKSKAGGDMVILGDLVLDGDCTNHPLFYLQTLSEMDAWYAFDIVSLSLPGLDDTPDSAAVDSCGFSPIQSSGSTFADPIRAVKDFVEETGDKKLWVYNLAIDADAAAEKAAERVTLPEVVESDYLARASGLLLAYGDVDKVFWAYKPEAGKPSAIALQSYANLAKTLSADGSGRGLVGDQGFEILRFSNAGKLSILTWHVQGGDEAQTLIIPDVGGYKLYAYSADADSLKTSKGIKMDVDAGGNTLLMVSERPVLLNGRPQDLKQSLTAMVTDSAEQAGQGLEAKADSWVQAQKSKAADKLGLWVEKQQASLMSMLKESFQQWLRQSLGLAKQ